MFRLWFSTKIFADYIVAHSVELSDLTSKGQLVLNQMYESDAAKPAQFHTQPTHIKNILYLDAPDLIIEVDNHPILSIEVSEEAGTGHNAFQRFCRLAAAVERGVPALYIYPEAVRVKRREGWRWDRINPLIFDALDHVMRVHQIPALLFYYPTLLNSTSSVGRVDKGLRHDQSHFDQPDSTDPEMLVLFQTIDLVVREARRHGHASPTRLMTTTLVNDRRRWMNTEWARRNEGREWSPLTATEIVPTTELTATLKKYAGPNYRFCTDSIFGRPETVIYKPDAGFRADPYAGALAAIDYIRCRSGKTYEDRDRNLAIAWGRLVRRDGLLLVERSRGSSISTFIDKVRGVYMNRSRVLLGRHYHELSGTELPRYFMQVRFGTTFTKPKDVRIFSYFCDAMLFHDGGLWREG